MMYTEYVYVYDVVNSCLYLYPCVSLLYALCTHRCMYDIFIIYIYIIHIYAL